MTSFIISVNSYPIRSGSNNIRCPNEIGIVRAGLVEIV